MDSYSATAALAFRSSVERAFWSSLISSARRVKLFSASFLSSRSLETISFHRKPSFSDIPELSRSASAVARASVSSASFSASCFLISVRSALSILACDDATSAPDSSASTRRLSSARTDWICASFAASALSLSFLSSRSLETRFFHLNPSFAGVASRSSARRDSAWARKSATSASSDADLDSAFATASSRSSRAILASASAASSAVLAAASAVSRSSLAALASASFASLSASASLAA